MEISEIKLAEIVHVTQKNKDYSWNSIDTLGRVESINDKELHLLRPNGVIERIEFDKGEKWEEPVFNQATEYLFLDEIDKFIETAQDECSKAEKNLEKITQFRHTFVTEMSFVARLKNFLR